MDFQQSMIRKETTKRTCSGPSQEPDEKRRCHKDASDSCSEDSTATVDQDEAPAIPAIETTDYVNRAGKFSHVYEKIFDDSAIVPHFGSPAESEAFRGRDLTLLQLVVELSHMCRRLSNDLLFMSVRDGAVLCTLSELVGPSSAYGSKDAFFHVLRAIEDSGVPDMRRAAFKYALREGGRWYKYVKDVEFKRVGNDFLLEGPRPHEDIKCVEHSDHVFYSKQLVAFGLCGSNGDVSESQYPLLVKAVSYCMDRVFEKLLDTNERIKELYQEGLSIAAARGAVRDAEPDHRVDVRA